MIQDNLATLPNSDPAIILRFRDRQYAAELIATAILEFDFFSYLDNQSTAGFQQICEDFGWQSRPADVLLTLCRASGFIATDSESRSQLTTLGREFLVRDSPWSLQPYYRPIADSPVIKDYAQILKTGKPANWQAKAGGADWHESMKDATFAQNFTDLMNCRGLAFGQHLAHALRTEMRDRKHLLDVGGGSGIYSAAMVAAHPHLRATVLEQAPVDEIARREIQRHAMTEKIDVCTADMFRDPWPENVDVVLLSNVLHDWDVPQAMNIVRRVSETLSDGGLVIIHGAFINANKSGPLPVAEYSALLMNITQGKCYSVKEYTDLLLPNGFAVGCYRDTTGDRGFLTAVKR